MAMVRKCSPCTAALDGNRIFIGKIDELLCCYPDEEYGFRRKRTDNMNW
jgi:hypothetical protein